MTHSSKVFLMLCRENGMQNANVSAEIPLAFYAFNNSRLHALR